MAKRKAKPKSRRKLTERIVTTRDRYAFAGAASPRFSCRKSSAIIRQIVGRLHVGATDAEVADYAASRLKVGATKATIRAVRKCAIAEHHHNQQLYRRVIGGRR